MSSFPPKVEKLLNEGFSPDEAYQIYESELKNNNMTIIYIALSLLAIIFLLGWILFGDVPMEVVRDKKKLATYFKTLQETKDHNISVDKALHS